MLTGIRVLAAWCSVPSHGWHGAGAGRGVHALACVSWHCQHGNAAQAIPKGTFQRGCEQGELQGGPHTRDAVGGGLSPHCILNCQEKHLDNTIMDIHKSNPETKPKGSPAGEEG